jgi:enamine deaminase RidA (YjgF/YER057c/UK114 family)
MSHRALNPAAVHPPFSAYSHAVETKAGARWLSVSGQVGVGQDGKTAQGFPAQCEQAWKNLLAILREAGMGPGDIVKVNSFLTRPSDVADSRKIRERVLGTARPASTLLIVAGLASPDWMVEIEVLAAKA